MSWDCVVVVGGCGFIGTNIVEEFVNKKLANKIVVLDNYTSSTDANHIVSEIVEYRKGNSWDVMDILDDVNPQIVFHLGEFSRIVTSFDKIDYVFQSNGLGTQRVAQYCVNKKARLVYSGSSSIFGNDSEDSNLSPYAFLKKQNIQLLHNYKSWYGLDYVITYFYNVYGPRDLESGSYATVVAKFRKQYAAGDPLTVVIPGNQRRIFTHVSDIVDGVFVCARFGSGDGYKLSSDDNLSIFELVKLFGEKATHVLVAERKGERFQSEMSASRARDELEWSPKIKLAEYIQDFVHKN